MSEVKVNKISPRTNCGTVQLGDSGDTITIPAGATITNNGTAAGFGATGAASWDTTVKTSGFTAVSGVGYFVNTTSGAITVTLPASPDAGAVIAVKDYANTFDTNNVTLARNGSNIGGDAIDATLSTEGLAVTLVYVDATQGWLVTDSGLQSDAPLPQYIVATGGTITCSGDYKIHTFTGPGTFTVCSVGNPFGSDEVSYMVVAAGGGAGGYTGGGGAGGFRESKASSDCYSASPLNATCGPGFNLPVSAQGYPITVGGGGAASTTNAGQGTDGGNSIFSTITSTGGGGSAGDTAPTRDGRSGGSGGANAYIPTNPVLGAIGAGNTPPVSPPQGNPSGNSNSDQATYTTGGGGGGATAAGGNASAPTGAPGGAGATTSINATPTTYAGGGGGGSDASKDVGSGGSGGGGTGVSPVIGTPAANRAGTDNTGGGGGGGVGSGPIRGGAGGSGIVIIRYKFQ